MGKITEIQWCDHTFNPWRGCAKVSPGCLHCYAEDMSKHLPHMGYFGYGERRDIPLPNYWKQPVVWNSKSKERQGRVLCSNVSEVFEFRPDLLVPRRRLLGLIERTKNLDWFLLTKLVNYFEPCLWEIEHSQIEAEGPILERTRRMAHNWLSGDAPPNVWLGASVEDQFTARMRIPELLKLPAQNRFLVVEPILGPIDLELERYKSKLSWVIIGGECGKHARTCDLAWVRSIILECFRNDVKVYVKQLGSKPVYKDKPVELHDLYGSLIDDWPKWIKVRDFPSAFGHPPEPSPAKPSATKKPPKKR